ELGTGLLLALSFFLLMMVGLASGNDKDQVDLSSYQGKNRILVVFSSSETNLMYKSFKIQLLRLDQEIRNRDILIIYVFESGDGWLGCLQLNREQALLLRKRFSINMGQSALFLIGKDGEVKLQKQLPVDLSDVFSIIDAMPMRQREIRERSE
ncbi:MAG: DUF4174 domain-containing protein, partial [Actinomycetota bacterium]|nr:DUF4174 domain-containing protein [Actinomycetota bacterium]